MVFASAIIDVIRTKGIIQKLVYIGLHFSIFVLLYKIACIIGDKLIAKIIINNIKNNQTYGVEACSIVSHVLAFLIIGTILLAITMPLISMVNTATLYSISSIKSYGSIFKALRDIVLTIILVIIPQVILGYLTITNVINHSILEGYLFVTGLGMLIIVMSIGNIIYLSVKAFLGV